MPDKPNRSLHLPPAVLDLPRKDFVDNSLFLSLPQHLAVSIDTDDLLYAQAPQRFGIRTADKSHTYHSKVSCCQSVLLKPLSTTFTSLNFLHLQSYDNLNGFLFFIKQTAVFNIIILYPTSLCRLFAQCPSIHPSGVQSVPASVIVPRHTVHARDRYVPQ